LETRGVVVKIKGNTCIVLTPAGEYRKAPLPKGGTYCVGREIELGKRNNFLWLKYLMAAASFLVIIAAGLLYQGRTQQAAAYYLTIDINPSIELAVSADGKVVSARGLNGEGEKILGKVKVNGCEVREAVCLVVAQAVADRYLGEGDEDNVILATVTVEGGGEPVVDLELVYEAIKKSVESGGIQARVIIEPVEPEMRREAARSGISTGRYFLMQKSAQKGVPFRAAEINSMSLGKLEKEKKINFVRLLEEDTRENGFIEKEHGNSHGEERAGGRAKQGIYVELWNREAGPDTKPAGREIIVPGRPQKDDRDKTTVKKREGEKEKEKRSALPGRGSVKITSDEDDGKGKNGRNHGGKYDE